MTSVRRQLTFTSTSIANGMPLKQIDAWYWEVKGNFIPNSVVLDWQKRYDPAWFTKPPPAGTYSGEISVENPMDPDGEALVDFVDEVTKRESIEVKHVSSFISDDGNIQGVFCANEAKLVRQEPLVGMREPERPEPVWEDTHTPGDMPPKDETFREWLFKTQGVDATKVRVLKQCMSYWSE